MRETITKLSTEPLDMRHTFAAGALQELTEGKLPEPLRKGLGSRAFPQERRLHLMSAFTDPKVSTEWSKICAAGPSALAGMVKLKPADQSAYLWEQCELDGMGLITAEEAKKTDGLALAAAMVAAGMLGKTAEVEREVLAFYLKASPVES